MKLICLSSAQHQIEAKQIYPDLSPSTRDDSSYEQKRYSDTAVPLFEDIELGTHDEHYSTPSKSHNSPLPLKTSTPTISHQKRNSNSAGKRHNSNEKTVEKDYQQNSLISDSNGVLLLLDANEHLTVSNSLDFFFE